MNRKNEFHEMLDQILIEIIEVEGSENKGDIPVLTKNVINMLRNLNQQIDEQQSKMDYFEEELQKMRRLLNILLSNEKTKAPEDGLDATFKVAGEAFKKTKLTMKDVDNAVKAVRRKAYGKKR